MATIRTVSNDIQNPAQFNTIQAAVNAAVAGDTIYVNATSLRYAETVNINKRLVLIGGGYRSSNQLGFTTQVDQLRFVTGGTDPSGSVICGFRTDNISALGVFSNIQIFRNWIPGGFLSISGNNWLVFNNIINGISIASTSTNIFIQNNILVGAIGGSTVNANLLIDHNLFLYGFGTFGSLQFATITNNIFAFGSGGGPIIQSSTVNNNFNNNLTNTTNVSVNAPTNSFAGGPNTASGNFVNTNPLFVNVPSLPTYDPTFNYRLQSSSPGSNAGTDGTDLGIYGGSYPFPSGGAPGSGFDTSPLPPIPQVNSVNIQNGTLASGTQLKVTIQATVNN